MMKSEVRGAASSAVSKAKPKARRLALLQAIGVARDPIGYLQSLQRQSGDPFCVRLPSVGDIYFTGDPEGVEEIFKAERDVFEPPEFNPVAPILGDHSLILLKGERHKKERKLMMPFFAGARMRAYYDVIAESTAEQMRTWTLDRELSAFEVSQSIILQVIFHGIFGVRDLARLDEFTTRVRALLAAYTTPLAALPFLRREFGGVGPWSTFLRLRDEFDSLLLEELQARRREGLEGREDILSLLMSARYDDGTALTDLELTEEVRTLLVGGHDTSSNTLAWAFYHILSAPEVAERIRQEVDALGDAPSPSDLTALPYLGAVCDEVLRLYPPVPFALRRLRKPFTLRGIQLVPGETLAVGMALLHRNPKTWERPDEFDPERFLERKYSLYEYAPYGGGVRRCIGAAFAGHALRVVLGTVLSQAQLSLARPVNVTAVSHSISIGPNQVIPMQYRGPRSPAAAENSSAVSDAQVAS